MPPAELNSILSPEQLKALRKGYKLDDLVISCLKPSKIGGSLRRIGTMRSCQPT